MFSVLTNAQILDLKGTARGDQQKLVDIFLGVTSAKDDLADTSFLTSLDMDPGSEQRGVLSPSSGAIPVAALFSQTPSPGSNMLPTFGGDSRSETPKSFGDFRRLVQFATRRDTYG